MNNKLLVLSNSFSGLHSFRKEVFQTFRNNGFEVYISCPIGKDVEKAKWFENIGCHIIDTQFNRQGMNPIADLKLVLTYRKIIKQVKPFAVLSYTIKPNVYGGMACRWCGVPQIANITGLGAAVEYPGLLQKITTFLYKLGMNKTHLTFFQNQDNLDFCNKLGIIPGRKNLIPGSGVNLSYHQSQPYPSESDSIRFLFVSRIRKEKGIDEYLAAAEHFASAKVEFHVVGGCEGDYTARLQKLNDAGVIRYHGRQSDVRPFFTNAHCTIHPTFYPEGMSNVLLESCATGRPIITTDRAGCREIVDNGVNGFIVRQKDCEDLIEKVDQFLALSYDKKKQMGLAARAKVEKEFDRQIVVDAYLNAVESLRSN